ncbi:Uncaracterized surface protein containing fasciclin (FAS1) repeats [Pricia antarctica]|uniref:Uncaracterized surface protein containing fasciclin (FAS1) repeats n=1 Tax=Pricia antarctica TaxID=641691 RepID=A0A1G7BXX9_9FLAO|nr:fasciclin domain-containing protein [Pricia antarctica]SDE31430.1 Uncaracterized surface protein containing fasciclin (FAS1) repeats [Pricia antarctica]
MKLKNTKILFLTFCTVLAMVSCKDQAKLDADKKAAEDKIAMEEAQAEKTKEEAKKKEMMATSIAAVAGKNAELSTLVSAVKAAGLDKMLSEPGSYTVFAPTNNAFEKLPKNLSIAELAKPENKELLTNILKYHVVAGEITSDQLVKAINGAKGKYKFKTVSGKELEAGLKGDQIILKDEKGNKTQVVLGNVEASNGIVHVINDVLIAKK